MRGCVGRFNSLVRPVNKSSWRDVTEAELAATGKVKRGSVGVVKEAQGLEGVRMPQERSKYRNVKTVIGTETFDSRRESDAWQAIKAREQTGEVRNVRRQVEFPLLAPDRMHGNDVMVARYVADIVYEAYDIMARDWLKHVVDAKGVRTQMYRLKRKWLELQDGIIIEEV